nr:hypothetical protein [Tanacetum cinerariifolium]
NHPAFYDDDDDEYSIQVSEKSPIAIVPVLLTEEPDNSLSMGDEHLDTILEMESDEVIKSSVKDLVPIPISEKSPIAIVPVLLTEEPDNSLSMGDEHLDTILEMESDEVIKSSVKDLVPIPSESEGILDNMCDVPFSDKNHFDAESDLIKSLLTRDTSIDYSPKINSLLEEFAGKLVHINPIPLGIDETNYDPKDDIRFIDQLLYDDTSSEDDSFEDIDYVEASPPDFEFVSLEEDSDFSSSYDSLGSDLEISFPSRTRNKIFDPGIFLEVQSKRFLSWDNFSSTYVSLPFEDQHYLSFTYVIQTFLLYFTYPVESLFLLSPGSEDIIFDPGISVFHFSSLEPMAFKCLMEVCSSTCFIPNITMISKESS